MAIYHWKGVLEERRVWQIGSGLPQNTVHALLQDRQGYIWMATEGGVARFDGLRFQVFSTEKYPELGSNDTRSLCNGEGGTVWVATGAGVASITGNQVTGYSDGSGLPGDNVLAVRSGPQGHIYARTPEGWSQFNGKVFHHVALNLPNADQMEPVPLPEDDPVMQARVLCTLRDHEGDLWVGTESGGVVELHTPRFTVAGSREGIAGDEIRCLYASRNGTTWIGTGGNGLTRYRDNAFQTITTSDGLPSDVILALGEAANGDLLVGTPDGLGLLHAGRWSTLTTADGLADDFIRSVAGLPDGRIAVGTRHGLTVLAGDAARTYTQSNGLGSDLIGALLPSATDPGALLIATARGVAKLTPKGGIEPVSDNGGVITALLEDKDGTLWLGTQANGLQAIQNGQLRTFSGIRDVPANVFGIADDDRGNLWLTARTGIYRLSKTALQRNSGEAVQYGTADGLRVAECSTGGNPTALRSPDGALWFATRRGVARMGLQQAVLNAVPPPVALEAVRVGEQLQTPAPVIRVQPGEDRFAFEYTALSFQVPQKIRFRYRLEGFDKAWVDAGARRVAYYTNLPPRRYRFSIMARNNDGLWGPPLSVLQLVVAPRYYQTWWFGLLCVGSLVLAVVAGYRLRVRQVQVRYQAVLQERSRIAREIHDTLAQGFAGVSLQLEILARLLRQRPEVYDETQPFLDSARTLVRDSLNEARRAIWQLRQDAKSESDLRTRLADMASEFDLPESRVTFAVEGAYRPLPPPLEDELFRIAQEAVRNAQRHAEAKNIRIILAFADSTVQVSVTDNGRGFSVPAARQRDGHYGLRGMEERAQSIGAKFTVTSDAGKGTAVSAQVSV